MSPRVKSRDLTHSPLSGIHIQKFMNYLLVHGMPLFCRSSRQPTCGSMTALPPTKCMEETRCLGVLCRYVTARSLQVSTPRSSYHAAFLLTHGQHQGSG